MTYGISIQEILTSTTKFVLVFIQITFQYILNVSFKYSLDIQIRLKKVHLIPAAVLPNGNEDLSPKGIWKEGSVKIYLKTTF